VTTTPGDPAVFAGSTAQVRITERRPAHPDASRLLRAFHREQVHRYGFADPIKLNAGEYTPPRGVFAVVYQDGTPIGCGGYRWFDRAARTVEIKRMYLTPATRGHGTGRALLTWLEHHAMKAGAHRAVLETGVRNIAALGLFTSAGYRPVDRYVQGRDPQINRAFARSLTHGAGPGQADLS
jgi:GNAT superfamily N-acetyltransferase